MEVMWPVVLAHEGNVHQIHEYANPDIKTALKMTYMLPSVQNS
jgi:hypothetical protein